jgi:hypothetical protein
VAAAVLVLLGFGHIYFTLYPPLVPLLFRDPRGFYGMPTDCNNILPANTIQLG